MYTCEYEHIKRLFGFQAFFEITIEVEIKMLHARYVGKQKVCCVLHIRNFFEFLLGFYVLLEFFARFFIL